MSSALLCLKIFVSVVLIVIIGTASPIQADCSWILYSDTNSPGGLCISNQTTLDGCRSFCVNSSTVQCYGIDWNPGGSQDGGACACWLSTSTYTQPMKGIQHYTFDCSATTTATTVSTTPGLQRTSAGCYWNASINSNCPNGVLQSFINGSDPIVCQNLCMVVIWCQGVDWNPGNPEFQRCFLSNSSVVNYNTALGVTHYQRKCTVGPLTTPPTGIKDCWTASNSMTTNNNMLQSYPDLPTCQNGCLQAGNLCKGIDWALYASVGSQCYFSTNTNVIAGSGSTIHYTYTMSCNTVTTSGVKNGLIVSGFTVLSSLLFNQVTKFVI